jgi:hypothetical protein
MNFFSDSLVLFSFLDFAATLLFLVISLIDEKKKKEEQER